MTTDESLVNWQDVARLNETMTFAVAIKTWRQCEPLTQVQAAQKLNLPKQLLSAYERGIKRPSPAEAFRIGQVYGMGGEMLALYVLNEQIAEAGLPFRVQKAS